MTYNTNTNRRWQAETIVLLHRGAKGSKSWRAVNACLTASAVRVFAPDMLRYGSALPPSVAHDIGEETAHLTGLLDRSGVGDFHLVTHSIGALFRLHLRRSLAGRVTRLTLVDPVVVSLSREPGEHLRTPKRKSSVRGSLATAAIHNLNRCRRLNL